ncbi:lytic transglycosylase domain-containing protein [Pseudomonas aeruginosa]|nr:lytic transglycosylase domain-containing protein [Pseudomonas aeruginosa]
MTAARGRPTIRSKIGIPLFAKPCSRFKMLHWSIFPAALPPSPLTPFVPLGDQTAGARSEGQGRPPAGACALPLTAASTLAGWWRSGDRTAWHYAVLIVAGALSVCAGSGVAVAQSAPVERPAAVHPYAAHIAEASQRFGIPEHWIRAVLRAESAGDVRAVSTAGAMGLMQVMQDTWAGLRVRHGLGRDPYDPRDNILAGTAYLREMFDRYGNVAAMLAAYNAGPGRYDEHRATGRPLPAETRAYVAALTPILGGAAATEPPSSAPTPPPDWREAPLFVMRPADTRAAVALPSEAQSGDGRAAVPARDPASAEPEDGSIFVASASEGGTP